MSSFKRSDVVYRINSTTSVVQASAIKNPEALAYGIGFLAHHRLYKNSKVGGVTPEKAREVLAAIRAAADEFEEDVVNRLEGKTSTKGVSLLGEGQVVNPYAFTGNE